MGDVLCQEPEFGGGGPAGAGGQQGVEVPAPAEGVWGGRGDAGLPCPEQHPSPGQEQGQNWASWTLAPSLELLCPPNCPKTQRAALLMEERERGTQLSTPLPHPHPIPALLQPFTSEPATTAKSAGACPPRSQGSTLVRSSGILWRHFWHRPQVPTGSSHLQGTTSRSDSAIDTIND